MEIVMQKVSKIIPYEKNTKKHDNVQIANVAESIKQYGFVQPIVLDKDNKVIIGHCRLLAAKKLNMIEIPCVYAKNLTKEQVNALRIVDNKTNESEWDIDFLIDELADVDLSMFDFDFDFPEEKIEEETERESIEMHESISVVIDCETDEEAEDVFNKLTEEGYECRISTL